MKYIRTENGIYETFEWLENGSCYYDNGDRYRYASSFDIIKQADTLEELCDEFVFEVENFKKVFLPFTFNKEEDLKRYDNIYGAVWCEFGLKYVAKFNSKGELELL